MTDLNKLFGFDAISSKPIYAVIKNPETNEGEKLIVKDIQIEYPNARLSFDLTDKQKQIKDPLYELHKTQFNIEDFINNNNARFPVQYARPPKPNKKWSRRYK